ncbi:MAG: hypothetical protein KDD70_07955 [Bdellovibrionales bacterium]|nr:hypothetical protein [Bdellovibrionales bacterium]
MNSRVKSFLAQFAICLAVLSVPFAHAQDLYQPGSGLSFSSLSEGFSSIGWKFDHSEFSFLRDRLQDTDSCFQFDTEFQFKDEEMFTFGSLTFHNPDTTIIAQFDGESGVYNSFSEMPYTSLDNYDWLIRSTFYGATPDWGGPTLGVHINQMFTGETGGFESFICFGGIIRF